MYSHVQQQYGSMDQAARQPFHQSLEDPGRFFHSAEDAGAYDHQWNMYHRLISAYTVSPTTCAWAHIQRVQHDQAILEKRSVTLRQVPPHMPREQLYLQHSQQPFQQYQQPLQQYDQRQQMQALPMEMEPAMELRLVEQSTPQVYRIATPADQVQQFQLSVLQEQTAATAWVQPIMQPPPPPPPLPFRRIRQAGTMIANSQQPEAEMAVRTPSQPPSSSGGQDEQAVINLPNSQEDSHRGVSDSGQLKRSSSTASVDRPTLSHALQQRLQQPPQWRRLPGETATPFSKKRAYEPVHPFPRGGSSGHQGVGEPGEGKYGRQSRYSRPVASKPVTSGVAELRVDSCSPETQAYLLSVCSAKEKEWVRSCATLLPETQQFGEQVLMQRNIMAMQLRLYRQQNAEGALWVHHLQTLLQQHNHTGSFRPPPTLTIVPVAKSCKLHHSPMSIESLPSYAEIPALDRVKLASFQSLVQDIRLAARKQTEGYHAADKHPARFLRMRWARLG